MEQMNCISVNSRIERNVNDPDNIEVPIATPVTHSEAPLAVVLPATVTVVMDAPVPLHDMVIDISVALFERAEELIGMGAERAILSVFSEVNTQTTQLDVIQSQLTAPTGFNSFFGLNEANQPAAGADFPPSPPSSGIQGG
ncbi:MAG: hypothetical protein QNK11_06560 [Legionella sp.]|nr:hypothetical protein [Legionella sp.]